MKFKTSIFALSLTVALASCAKEKKQAPPAPTPAPTATPKSKPSPTKKAAKDEVEDVTPEPVKVEKSKLHGLDKKQRIDFMKKEIMPKMTEVFQAFDAKHFAKVTCITCHGPGAKDDKFEMPTASLPKLDFSKKDPKHEKWNEFMGQKVVPTMATALGRKPYDRATKTGFGCLSCHMKK